MAKSKKYLVWIDCEMTGLDPATDRLLEIASLITNYDLEIVARGPVLPIRQSAAILEKMDAWNRKTHKKSGLLTAVQEEGVTVREAEAQTLAFIKRHCYARTAPLCGSSIGHDKRFLARYMPSIVEYLHYRVIDVSSVKLLVANWYDDRFKPPEGPEVHRALPDIEQSIAELRHYREHAFVRP